MARIQTFAKDLQLATEGIAPAAIRAALAKFATDSLAAAIREGEGSPIYDRYVNGVLGKTEAEVIVPGPILYEFHWWKEIIEYAIKTLQARSPVKTGRYKTSWHVIVNGMVVKNFDKIGLNDTVMITNDQPYSRKIEVGFMEMSVPPGVVEDSKTMVMRRYGNIVKAQATMINLPNGYVLKGVFRRGIRKNSRTKLRKDTQAGAEMTYPTLTMEMRA